MIQVTMYARFKKRLGDVNLIDVLDDIRTGKYAPSVNRIRVYMDKGNADAADTMKKGLPAITLSATYSGQRLDKFMNRYNPLIILDFDKQKKEDLPRLLTLTREAPYTVACWISPRGMGIKAIVYPVVGMELVSANHRAVYKRVREWYEHRLGIEADASGSDPGRLCIVSYDPNLYLSSRFAPWLKGGGSLPEGLPQIEPVIPDEVTRLLTSARKKTTRKMVYAEGNRNNYVHLFAGHCNRLGIRREEVERYAAGSFADLSPEERLQAIGSAYAHTEQHATKQAAATSGRGNGFVGQIQDFLAGRFELRRNVVRNKVEYRDPEDSGEEFCAVTDYWENSVWCALQKSGVYCRLSDLRSVIHSDFSPEYNPFKSYFERLPPWDGVTDAIARLAATVDTTRPDFWAKCLKKWMVAVVACAINERKANHTVLLLSGAQGIGKTTWLRNLVPPALRSYMYSGNLDPTDKDASLMMSDCFLVILDELSGQSKMELNRMKAMITKDAILERRPYARNAESFVRRASFAATVNDSQVLTDHTGSRRFLCFETLRIDYTSAVDHNAIYAQVLALYRAGFCYWFANNDIAELNDNNETFQQLCPEAELLFTYFRKPTRFENPLLLSASEILTRIAERTRFHVTTTSVIQLGKVLKSFGFTSVLKHGKRLYHTIELNHDQVVARQKGFGCDSEGLEKEIDNERDMLVNASEPKLPF